MSMNAVWMRLFQITRLGLWSNLVLLLITQSSFAATWQDELPQAKVLGHGEFTWFGLSIYKAQLWSEHQPFNRNTHFALELTYQRSLTGSRIAETGIKEIKRIYGSQVSSDQLKRWQGILTNAIPNVKDGSKLIAVYEPAQGMRIYDSKRLIADIADPDLAQAFFSIWLDERTKDQALRDQLLGTQAQ